MNVPFVSQTFDYVHVTVYKRQEYAVPESLPDAQKIVNVFKH